MFNQTSRHTVTTEIEIAWADPNSKQPHMVTELLWSKDSLPSPYTTVELENHGIYQPKHDWRPQIGDIVENKTGQLYRIVQDGNGRPHTLERSHVLNRLDEYCFVK